MLHGQDLQPKCLTNFLRFCLHIYTRGQVCINIFHQTHIFGKTNLLTDFSQLNKNNLICAKKKSVLI
ncbi:hypothetical protein XELAEV_18044709mg [Xenopus laevis]|uniref:Uncharacterized protein n=1 Tax=Xenopus laevis TaxID=8355 RepID=A0A974BZH4_XENLA|nr:hypothetical protein XELAEV_18044709mg [Xenopus laevis]